jgi:FG-GAP repeat
MTNNVRHAARVWCVAVSALAWPATAAAQMVLGPGAGCPAEVHLIEGSLTRTVQAYDHAFLGGVSVALGDVNADGTPDIITGAGPGGGPHVEVFSGLDLSLLASFFAYSPAFQGGVHVAAGDVNGDGRADTGAGPHVEVFSGADLRLLVSFFRRPTGTRNRSKLPIPSCSTR